MRVQPLFKLQQRWLLLITAVVAAPFLCGSTPASISPAATAERAFVVTDPRVLAPFTFVRIVQALGGEAEAWLSTLAATSKRHLSEKQSRVIMPFTGFIAAPENGKWRPAGARDWSYVRPIAIVNRFDLAAADFSTCGEYRLIYSQRHDDVFGLNIAVELVLPNPDPIRRREGCRTVAAFWQQLAARPSSETRRRQLEKFFFEGLPASGPALDRRTFEQTGRIRTSAISNARPKFGQFEARHHCALGHPCSVQLKRVPLDNTPNAVLFDAGNEDERAASFRNEFLRQVPSLSVDDVNRYSMTTDRRYSVSDFEDITPAFNYRLPFQRSQRTEIGREFRERIAKQLAQVGSRLTPEDIINRAETQNCMGCHGKPGPVGGDVIFPKASESGAHVADEAMNEPARLSMAVQQVFVPFRIEFLRQYVESVKSSDRTRREH